MKRDLKVEFFIADNGEYCWHIKAANGKLIATAGETFKRKSSAIKSFDKVRFAFTRNAFKAVELWN